MVSPIYSNRKGIYSDLYREIDAENNKRKKSEKNSQARRPKKGIYVELYKQIKFKNNDRANDQNNFYTLAFKKFVIDIISRISYYFSTATGEIKMLIIASMVAKKPINSYIENNLDTCQDSNYP